MPAPFDLTRFHELLRTRSLGRNFIFEPAVGSTMDVARDAAQHGAPEGTVAAADEQTAGRGRLGRSWVTPPASNLATTIVVRPPPAIARQVAMIAPLAVCNAVAGATGIRADIKWPNDVQIHGKKLAGILIESDVDADPPYLLVGCGINVNFDPRAYDEIRDIATSLLIATGDTVEREPLLAAYLLHFEDLYDAAKAGLSPRDDWRSRLVTIGQKVKVSWPGGSVDGTAFDADHDGSLIVLRDDGTLETVEAGDVTLRV
ncbi:MAG: biotin--[acetyl-CoA-carboxylase] ligase [Dehalococcoidia bacterium]